MTVETEIFESFESLESMRPEWDLFVQMAGCAIFMTFDWLRVWWKYYGAGRQLKICVFRYEGQLVGIIPLFFEKIRFGPVSIRCGKIVGSDFTLSTIILPIQKEFLCEVLRKFLAKIKNCCRWDVLHIGPLSGLYSDSGEVLKLCRQHLQKDYRVSAANNNVQTFFLLVDDNGKPTDLVSKRQERHLRQKYHALQEIIGDNAASLISRFATSADFEESFANFVRMHQRHWQKQNQQGHFGDWPKSQEFHHELAETQLKQDRLRLLEVKADGQPLGYKYAYKFGDTCVGFLDTRADDKRFSRAGLGNIIYYELFKKAQQEHVRYIDSGRGKYEHKLRIGGKLFDINNIYIFRNNLFTAAKVNTFRFLACLLDICYYKVWYSRLAPKLPLRRKPLWKLWIRSAAFAG